MTLHLALHVCTIIHLRCKKTFGTVTVKLCLYTVAGQISDVEYEILKRNYYNKVKQRLLYYYQQYKLFLFRKTFGRLYKLGLLSGSISDNIHAYKFLFCRFFLLDIKNNEILKIIYAFVVWNQCIFILSTRSRGCKLKNINSLFKTNEIELCNSKHFETNINDWIVY